MHGKLKNTPNKVVTVLLVFSAVVLGYATMWLTGYYASSDNSISIILLQLVMIAVVGGIAYAILKGIFHSQRLKDPHERELRFKDLPKDAPESRVKH